MPNFRKANTKKELSKELLSPLFAEALDFYDAWCMIFQARYHLAQRNKKVTPEDILVFASDLRNFKS